TMRVIQRPGVALSECLVDVGLFPATPRIPTLAFSVDVLEFYRILRRRVPSLGVEPFIKSACVLQNMEYIPGMQENFSWAFDYYLRALDGIQSMADAQLEGPGALTHGCPPCDFKLPGEQTLDGPGRLLCMDGGMSFKRVESAGRCDERVFQSPFFKPRSDVDEFRKELPSASAAIVRSERPPMPTPDPPTENSDPMLTIDDKGFVVAEEADDRCGTNWLAANGRESGNHGIFEQTGLFVCLCRHGRPETLLEMVRSGELSAYPLACIQHVIQKYGKDNALGFDLGCLLAAVCQHSRIADEVTRSGLSFFVDGFHGSAHKRDCQLKWMVLNNPDCGVGNEDFAGCERFFSQVNRAAVITRYASNYRWKQGIHLAASQVSDDRYASIGAFELGNFKQAISEIEVNDAWLRDYTSRRGFSEADFKQWLIEERAFQAETKKKESWEQSTKVEYVEALEKLAEARAYNIVINNDDWIRNFTPPNAAQMPDRGSSLGRAIFTNEVLDASRGRALETLRRDKMRALELRTQLADHAESVLGVAARWTPGDKEYQDVLQYIKHKKFARAVDVLEGAIVSRDSEFWKANLSNTNYKSRRHISSAIVRRNGALYAAFKRYNELAILQSPPRPALNPKDVLEHNDLSTLDILKTSRHDILSKPWTQAQNRQALLRWLKIQSSKAELDRISVEVPRIQAWVDFDDNRRLDAVRRTSAADPALALFIDAQRIGRRQTNNAIRLQLQKIYRASGYTGPRPAD
ncbi:hypothetical protein K488DRAFT_18789, partial [Vararia minispora EC-137]